MHKLKSSNSTHICLKYIFYIFSLYLSIKYEFISNKMNREEPPHHRTKELRLLWRRSGVMSSCLGSTVSQDLKRTSSSDAIIRGRKPPAQRVQTVNSIQSTNTINCHNCTINGVLLHLVGI